MGTVRADISISLDGYVAGPHDGLGRGLGEGGEGIHAWIMGGPWTYDEGASFGATGVDRELMDEMFEDLGASVVGRRMYDVVDGWGEGETFPVPVFVLTSRPHPVRKVSERASYTFVTDGIHAALEQAQAAAGDKRVHIGGGARTISQYLAAGLVDELSVHVTPVLLGAGTRLFEELGTPPPRLEQVQVRESPYATHIRYRVG
jgi:dihydrofolate reductase